MSVISKPTRVTAVVATGLCIGATASIAAPVEPSVAASTPTTDKALDLTSARVFIEGDSLTVGSTQALRSQLRSRVKSVAIDAKVGRFSREGIARLRTSNAKRASIWVVALGTNDSPSASQTRRNVAKVMHLAGSERRVIWVNVVRPGGYSRVNRELGALDAKYPRLTVIDWAAVIRKQRSLLSGDRVHLTPKGYWVRAVTTRQALVDLETAAI